MSKKTINMIEGSPLKLLIAFTIPMILGNVFQQIYSMVDAIVVGKFVSKQALAAIGATGSILFLMISIIVGFTVGITIVTAQFMGARDQNALRKTFATGFWIILVESVFLAILGNLLIHPALLLLDTPADIIDQADTYLRINFTTCAAPILYYIISPFMRSLGDSKTPLCAMIISSFVNIVLDLVFVLCFGMGVAGVAIATVIAQVVSSMFCLVTIIRRFPEIVPKRGEWHPDFSILKNILRFGIPTSLQNLLVSLGMMFVQAVINGYGTNVVAGYTAASKVDQIALQFMHSIGSAASTYAGQNYGAKKLKRLISGLRASLAMNACLSLFLTALMVAFGRYIALLFIDTGETDAIAVAVRYLTTVGIFYILCGIGNVFTGYLRGINYAAIPTIASISELVAKIAVSFFFSILWGHTGIWWAWPISWTLTVLFLGLFYFLKAKPTLRRTLSNLPS